MKYLKTFENMAMAKSIISKKMDGFEKLKTLLKSNLGYIGKFTDYLMNENIPFSDLESIYNDLVDFYTTYNQRLISAGVVSDPTNIGYYRYVNLKVPVLSLDPDVALNESCGDTTTFVNYIFHTSSVVTTGVTGNLWYMNLTMPTISKQINYTQCELYCNSTLTNQVNSINAVSTGSTNNISWVNNRGNRVNIPFYSYSVIFYNSSSNTNSVFNGYERISNFLNKTLPLNNTNFSLIPSLSAKTCNLVGEYYPKNSVNGLNDDYYLK
jgi:hypothetical protein